MVDVITATHIRAWQSHDSYLQPLVSRGTEADLVSNGEMILIVTKFGGGRRRRLLCDQNSKTDTSQ